MFIYLARPIDQAGINMILNNADRDVLDAIQSQGHATFRPAWAYVLPRSPWEEPLTVYVDSINQYALAQADGLIAILLPDIPTMGTVVEVEQALAAGKPVCVITTEKLRQSSVQLAAWAARGAFIAFCSEEGRIFGLDIKAALTPEPSPGVRQLLDATAFDGKPAYVEGRLVKPGDLQVMYTNPAAKPLQRAHPTDAGLDLATLEDAMVEWGSDVLIPTGIIAPPPEGWWGLIKARSSTQRDGIHINEGVIDAGYQGELFISATLAQGTRPDRLVPAGTRLAQYILTPVFPGRVVPVQRFAESTRGEKGWGSSGS